MKKFKSYMVVFFILGTTAAFSQTTQLGDLTTFSKLIVDGKVTVVEVAPARTDISIFIEGTQAEHIIASVEADVLYLKVNQGDNLVVRVFNNDLKRIEGQPDLEVTGAEVIGRNGKFLITQFTRDAHQFMSSRGGHDFDFVMDHNFDVDFDIDLHTLEDLNLSVNANIDDHDWVWEFDWEWEWEWNWEDHDD